MGKAFAEIRIYGAFTCTCARSGKVFPLTGKTAALLALLVVSANGRRTRVWLQSMLWPRSGASHGRASLRQALASLRRTLGDVFPKIVETSNQDIWVKLDAIELSGSARDGVLLEGLECPGADGYHAWLSEQRQLSVVGLDEFGDVLLPVVARPVQTLEAQEVPSGKIPKFRPALAILPFAFVASDRPDVLFGDMIAGDLSRLISRSHGIDVISHMSCRAAQFCDADLARLRADYSVDYLVTGFLRPAANDLTLDIDFTDCASGIILDSKRFTQAKSDWLLGKEGMLRDIANYIVTSLFKGAVKYSSGRRMGDLEAHTLLMSAIALMHRQDLASVLRSYQYLENIIVRFGPSSLPYAWLAQWYVLFLAQGWSTDIAADKASARRMANLAREANPDCSFSMIMSGLVSYQLERSYDIARATFDDVLTMNESNAHAWFWKGTMLAFEGKGEEAVAFTERGRFLSPLDPGGYLYSNLAGTAHLSNRNYAKALGYAEQSLSMNRHHASALRTKIVALHGLQKFDEAKNSARSLLEKHPEFTVAAYLSAHPAGELKTGQEWARALRDSGVPSG